MYPAHTLVLTQGSRKRVKFGAGFGFPAFPPCLFAMLDAEALAGGGGQFTTPVPCDAWLVEFQVMLEPLVLLGEVGELWLRAGGSSTGNHIVLCQDCKAAAWAHDALGARGGSRNLVDV